MIFRSLCAFIWFKSIEKLLLQMTSGLQLESTINVMWVAIVNKTTTNCYLFLLYSRWTNKTGTEMTIT
jgi:hypothetical protein